ncbi:amidohydrolase family protein [Stenomitos frigidus]|uniref:Amidohydrolase n=1 Tax=Stenomitos frigidus ULC18 TaxID=2107698 RepID=A0A2T1E5T6_9CYAN|nr:amidohydrolase family protein [Stenomitos frigidus]PSB28117.1 amidohydrolase [Stenomitos frigidus ULC18]
MLELTNCIILHGPDLEPHHCHRFTVKGDTIAAIVLGAPCQTIDQGALVILPGMYNSHTHLGDAIAPDGATGMTLEQGFFRPDGYKYRRLAQQPEADHLRQMTNHLHYMARTGTIGHLDFREQGVYGSQLLRRASEATGVRSIILGQFNQLPFTAAELQQNQVGLTKEAIAELKAVLAIADGFSESTMNDLTDAAWLEIYQLTAQQQQLRAIHCLENEGYRDVSLALTGRGDLERALELYQPHLVIHATVANADDIALLSQQQVNVVLNPRANANLGLPLPPIAPLLQSNANLLLGTDNGLLNSPNLLAELDFTYKVAKSQFGNAKEPAPQAILKMVTSNIRPVLGGDTYGYLATGLPADYTVLNFHQPHLRSSQHIPASIVTRVTPEDVLATVYQGKVLWQAEKATVLQTSHSEIMPI